MKLSIVIPCYNEGKNIPLLLNKFKEIINRDDIEVVIVNNGSTDNSAMVLRDILTDYPFVHVVNVKENKGYGFGILQGLAECKGDYIGWTHADLQTDPQDVIKAIEIIESQSESMVYVKGNRKGRPLMDQVFTTGMSIFESIYLGERLYDINAQPNVFSRAFYESWEDPPHDFSLDLYALYKARKQKIKLIRFDVIFPERLHGSSSWNTGFKAKKKFIKRTLEFSRKLKKTLD